MRERTAEKEFEALKGDVLNLFEAIVVSYKQKYEAARAGGEKAVEELKGNIEEHPKITALIGGTILFGLGVLATKLWLDRSRR